MTSLSAKLAAELDENGQLGKAKERKFVKPQVTPPKSAPFKVPISSHRCTTNNIPSNKNKNKAKSYLHQEAGSEMHPIKSFFISMAYIKTKIKKLIPSL